MATEQTNTKEQEVISTNSEVKKLNGNNNHSVNPVDENAVSADVKKTSSAKKANGQKKKSIKPAAKTKKIKPAVKSVSKKTGKEENTLTQKNENPVVKKERKPKVAEKKKPDAVTTKLIFQLKFYTKPGESLFIIGDHELFGNDNFADALPMQYLNEGSWVVSIDMHVSSVPEEGIEYNYVLKHEDNFTVYDRGKDKKLTPDLFKYEEVLIAD